MDFEKELKAFKEIVAMVAFLENELELLIEQKNDNMIEDGEIEANALSNTNHTIVNAGSNHISKVESQAISYVMNHNEHLNKEIRAIEKKLKEYRYMMKRMEAMLSVLTQREKLVIQKFFIDGYPWSDVVAFYKEQMPSPREADALKATRSNAIAKMKKVYCKCKEIGLGA